jgi:hypothetical protein
MLAKGTHITGLECKSAKRMSVKEEIDRGFILLTSLLGTKEKLRA